MLSAERAFLEHAFAIGADGKLLYSEWVYSAPKKSGKTTFAALIVITMVLLFGGSFPEAFALAKTRSRCNRGCSSSPSTSRRLENCQLPDRQHSDRKLWPPPQPSIAAAYAAMMTPVHDPAYSANWHAVAERRREAVLAEQQRLADYYELRRAEERERFLSQQRERQP